MNNENGELSTGEIQHTLLQFMGQNMGEFKKLGTNIIEGNSTLQGMTLQPERVLKSVSDRMPPIQTTKNHPVAVVQPQQQPQEAHTEEPNKSNQMVFDFMDSLNKNPSIVDKIMETHKTVDQIKSHIAIINRNLEEVKNLINEKSFDQKHKKHTQALNTDQDTQKKKFKKKPDTDSKKLNILE